MTSLSKRSVQLKADPHFVSAFAKVFADFYHPDTNPNGYINLAVAENVLMAQEMCQKIQEIQAKFPIEPRHLNYTDFSGAPEFKRSLAHLFENYIFSKSSDGSSSNLSGASVNTEHLIVGNGAGSILELLGSILCDEDEYIMIPAPMYLAFPNDFGKRFNCKVLPVHLPYNEQKNRFELSITLVQQCYERASREGKVVRAFLLCTPNNPTGEIYSEETMRQLMDWCEHTRIHFISDEVYALSIFNNNEDSDEKDGANERTNFVSAGRLMLDERFTENGGRGCDFTHLVYSFSKDFTLNGFRIGVLYTHNADVLQACRSCSYFTSVSSYTQQMMSHLLLDDEFVQFFVAENAKRMAKAYESVVEALHRNNVKYMDAKGGMFLFVYLGEHIRRWMKKSADYQITSEDETAFWDHILNVAKVNISAGSFFLCTHEPGWFRICFTATPVHILQLGFDRIFKSIE